MGSAWDAASLLDLPAIHKAMESEDDEAISALGRLAGAAGVDAWKVHARAIGELQRRAAYADAAVPRIAKEMKISRSTAFDLGAIDKKILLPRLREEGDAATFPIKQRHFYSLACKLAPLAGKSPLAILHYAEEARRGGKRFSARQLKEHFGAPVQSDPITICLAKLAAFERKHYYRYAHDAKNPHEALRLAEAAAESVRLLKVELAGQVKA